MVAPVTYDRPIPGKLMVVLENGESWEAGPSDILKFGYVHRLDTYMRFRTKLYWVLQEGGVLPEGADLTDAALNPLRYLVELAVCSPEVLEMEETKQSLFPELVELERTLQSHEILTSSD